MHWYDDTDNVPNPNNNPCEQTSASAIDGAFTASVYPLYDHFHYVGGRADVVAHSMGGLASRHYGSLSAYTQNPRSRTLGGIHDLITVDTPELGSGLADYSWRSAMTPFNHCLGTDPPPASSSTWLDATSARRAWIALIASACRWLRRPLIQALASPSLHRRVRSTH